MTPEELEKKTLEEFVNAKVFFRRVTAERLESTPPEDHNAVMNGMFRAMLVWAGEMAIDNSMSEDMFVQSCKGGLGYAKAGLAIAAKEKAAAADAAKKAAEAKKAGTP